TQSGEKTTTRRRKAATARTARPHAPPSTHHTPTPPTSNATVQQPGAKSDAIPRTAVVAPGLLQRIVRDGLSSIRLSTPFRPPLSPAPHLRFVQLEAVRCGPGS